MNHKMFFWTVVGMLDAYLLLSSFILLFVTGEPVWALIGAVFLVAGIFLLFEAHERSAKSIEDDLNAMSIDPTPPGVTLRPMTPREQAAFDEHRYLNADFHDRKRS